MTRATLLALAERVEAATRGSDELDAHIRCALFGKPDNFVKQSHINGAWCVWRIDGAGREVAWDGNGLTQLQRLGAFTASLDAAMSLAKDNDRSELLNEAMEAVSLNGWKDGEYLQELIRAFVAASLRAIAGSIVE